MHRSSLLRAPWPLLVALALVVPGLAAAAPPSPPTLSVPYAGSTIHLARPPVVIQNATDPDGDALTYEVDLATDGTFATVEQRLGGAPRAGAGHVIVELPADLAEDSRHCWRARAHDGQAAGEYRAACFRVSTVNDPPGPPELVAPADGARLEHQIAQLSWAGAVDPEGAGLTYELELEVPGAGGPWSISATSDVEWVSELGDVGVDVTYQWRVRAIDPDHVYSVYSTTRSFIVPPIPVETDVGGNGCTGCGAGGGAGPGPLLVIGLGLIALRRRGRARTGAGLAALLVVAGGIALPRAAAAGNQPPAPPVLVSPRVGEVVPSVRPVFVAHHAVDPDGDPLRYDWELAQEPSFAVIEAGGQHVAPSGDAFVGFELDVDLGEDSRRCWRVRADDGQSVSAYTAACFIASEVNEPPSTPIPNNPGDQQGATTNTPVYSWTPAIDAERDPITYDVELADEAGVAIESIDGVIGTVTSFAEVLVDRADYQWRVRAVDRPGAASAWSPWSDFSYEPPTVHPELIHTDVGCGASRDPGGSVVAILVALALVVARRRGRALAAGGLLAFAVASPRAAEAGSHPPAAPVLVSPRVGDVVPVLRPVLIAHQAVDLDGDPLVYDWDLAPDPTFAVIEASGRHVAPSGDAFVGFDVGIDLVEDSRHCWRVRADDGLAVSAYTPACFVASTVNGPPTVPVLNNPSDQQGATTTTPVFSWAPSTDVEDDPIAYDIEVADERGAVLGSVVGVRGTVTAIDRELRNGGSYQWRARAVDRPGAASEWSAWNTFAVNAPSGDPQDIPTGSECGASREPGGSLAAVLIALTFALTARRRRGRTS